MIIYLAGIVDIQTFEGEMVGRLGANRLNSYWYAKDTMEQYEKIYKKVGVERESKNHRIKGHTRQD